VLRRVIAVGRAARLALHLAYGLGIAVSYPWLALSLQRRILRRWSIELLDVLGVEILLDSDDALHRVRHGLIVTNHISWLDVFVLNAVVPMRFVAKSEVRRWPVIGWLCARAQTIFLERGNPRAAARLNVQLVEMLQRGECLAVFPEGTTTDGARVAHFHPTLLQPAIDAGAPLHPIAIRYQDERGQRSDAAAYIDDLSFGASLWQIMSAPCLQVRLVACAPLDATDSDRRTLTRNAHQHITAALQTLDEVAHSAQYGVESVRDDEFCAQSLHCLLLSPPLERGAAAARH
jgi:1-acyl-sn-glycerol-3-phosphate acyltransferase